MSANDRFLSLFVLEILKDKVKLDIGVELKLSQIHPPRYLHKSCESMLYYKKAFFNSRGVQGEREENGHGASNAQSYIEK